jgi:hypothetical protein
MFADEFLPVCDVSDEVATVVAADPPVVWEALLVADLIDVGKRTSLAGLLGALRVLPELVSHLVHGEQEVARTRWPSDRVNPGLFPGQADQTGTPVGAWKSGPGRQIDRKTSPKTASAE